MASMLDAVDQRTKLVGENRLELLMFRLSGMQMFCNKCVQGSRGGSAAKVEPNAT